MTNALKELFASKKFLMAIAATLVALGAKFGLQLDEQTIGLVMGVFVTAIFGQGLADHGKEKAKIEAANPVSPAPTVVNTNINEPTPPSSGGGAAVAMFAILLLGLGAGSLSTGCVHNTRHDTIQATFAGASSTADAFARYSDQHQLELVANAASKEEAVAAVDDFRQKRDKANALLILVLNAAVTADRLNDDHSTAALIDAALNFHNAVNAATGGKIK